MKKLDFTNFDDISEFAENYYLYKDQVSLPKEILDRIEKCNEHYANFLITSNERYNQIVGIIYEFMKDLNAK